MDAAPQQFKTEININLAPTPEEGAIWMFYPMGRSMFITKHPELYEGIMGNVTPTFEEEIQGRSCWPTAQPTT